MQSQAALRLLWCMGSSHTITWEAETRGPRVPCQVSHVWRDHWQAKQFQTEIHRTWVLRVGELPTRAITGSSPQPPSRCKLSKVRMRSGSNKEPGPAPSTWGMRETAACPPSPAGTILQLHHLPPPLPPLGSDASCLFTWPAPVCQLLYCATILCWRRKQQPTPVLSPGESHGQRCLAGYSPWDGKSQTRLSDQTTTTTTTILSKALYCKIKNVFLLCVF